MRMHGDEKYRRLTPCPPCGQALWWHIIAGEQTNVIPGLFKISEVAFADQLGWPIKGFREAFAEVFLEGMAKADWAARLVWVPNAIRYNAPASPNVVRSWRYAWDEIPECELKVEAHQSLKDFLEAFDKDFREAFDKTCGKPFRKPLANQEQDQEQKQEQEKRSASVVESQFEFPAELNTEAFRGAWKEWIEYRQQIKKKMTPATVKKQLADLAKLGEFRATESINKSIRNGWTGIAFQEPSKNGQLAPAPVVVQSEVERAKRDIDQIRRLTGGA